MSKSITITIKVTKDRNPYTVLALFRKAGSHKKSNKAMRKQIKEDVHKALKEI